MNTPFFITGLPRSRTAWLANLFTTGGQFCWHDLLGQVRSFREFRDQLHGGRGDSDSGLLWVYPRLRTMFPAARWLLVDRPPAECVDSLRRAAIGTPWADRAREFAQNAETWLPVYAQRRAEMLADRLVRTIRFEDLATFEDVFDAWSFLCPDTQLDRARFHLLDALRVEPIPAKCPIVIAPELEREISEWLLPPQS